MSRTPERGGENIVFHPRVLGDRSASFPTASFAEEYLSLQTNDRRIHGVAFCLFLLCDWRHDAVCPHRQTEPRRFRRLEDRLRHHALPALNRAECHSSVINVRWRAVLVVRRCRARPMSRSGARQALSLESRNLLSLRLHARLLVPRSCDRHLHRHRRIHLPRGLQSELSPQRIAFDSQRAAKRAAPRPVPKRRQPIARVTRRHPSATSRTTQRHERSTRRRALTQRCVATTVSRQSQFRAPRHARPIARRSRARAHRPSSTRHRSHPFLSRTSVQSIVRARDRARRVVVIPSHARASRVSRHRLTPRPR